MTKLDELSQRRRNALKRLADASSIADVARKANKDPAQLWGMVKGFRPFGERVARSLEINLGLDTGYFDRDESLSEVDPTYSSWTKIPLIDLSDAANFSTAKHKDYVFTMLKKSQKSFSVTLTDDAMAPTARANDIALVDPDTTPKPGNIVVATINHVPTIGRYRRKSLSVFEIAPDNPDYPAIRSDEAEITVIGTVYQLQITAL